MSGPGRVLGHGEHPGGPDPRQVQQAGRLEEGWMGGQGKLFLIFHKYFSTSPNIISLQELSLRINFPSKVSKGN